MKAEQRLKQLAKDMAGALSHERPAPNQRFSFKQLKIGDRFYFFGDTKKEVFELIQLEPYALYKSDKDRHARNAKPADFQKEVIFLRHHFMKY